MPGNEIINDYPPFSANQMADSHQNILDNVSLLDEKLLEEINDIVVEAGAQLLKKQGVFLQALNTLK